MRGAALLLVFLCAFSVAAQESDPHRIFQEAAQAQQRGDYALAARKFQEVIRLDANVVAAHANLAVVLVSLGRYDEAITQYQIALAEAPGDPALRLNLGLGYYKKGDFAGAAAQFASLHVTRLHLLSQRTSLSADAPGNCLMSIADSIGDARPLVPDSVTPFEFLLRFEPVDMGQGSA